MTSLVMGAITLFLLHGWGFDHFIWDPLRAELGDVAVAVADLGYFAEPRWPEVNGPTVAVGHSLGSLLLLRNPPPDCRALVAINGFDRFTGTADVPGVSPRIVERMRTHFPHQPAQVLAEFRRRCGCDHAPQDGRWGLLEEHLLLLRDADERHRTGAWDKPVLSLQAADDPILPAGLRDAAFSNASSVRRIGRPDGGHLLPVTQPGWCAEQIGTLLAELS